jgi:cyclic pyranopterin phosphate synthase
LCGKASIENLLVERDGPLTTNRSDNPSVVYWLNNKLYLNITNRCTNDCYFCLRRFKQGIGEFTLRLKSEPSSADVISELQKVINLKPWSEIVFCGFGEPTIRLNTLLGVARWIRRNTRISMRLDTNGQALLLFPEREVAAELKEAGVTTVSVSLNTYNKELYDEICRPKFENAFEKVLEFAKTAREAGLSVEVTAVAVPETEISKVEKVASSLGVRFRARPYRGLVW